MAIEHFLHIKGDKISPGHFIKYCANRAINYELMREIRQEGLFLYNSDLELCYFKENGSRIINDGISLSKQSVFNHLIHYHQFRKMQFYVSGMMQR